MALKDEKVQEVIKPYLEQGETLENWAFGVKQPHILLMVFLFMLAILPGIIGVVLLTRNYLVGLTQKRFIVVRIGARLKPREVMEYKLGQVGEVRTSTGGIFTHIKILDPNKPFIAKFHRMGMKNNREHSIAIARALNPAHNG